MADFLRLIQNENMKIYSRVRTWVMYGFVVLLPPIISLIIYLTAGNEPPSNWMAMMIETSVLMQLITIFTVVQASESVAGEFTWGTIKLLLIRPWSRTSILLSKYLAVLLFALFFAVSAFAVTLLVNMAFFGYNPSPHDFIGSMTVADGASKVSPMAYMIKFYALELVSLLMIVTFGFMMSSAFRSSGLAIGLSIFLLLSGSVISQLFALAHKAWVKYVIFMHLNLTSYLNGGKGPIPDYPMTLGFSLAVLAGYFIVFNFVSWYVFNKRDVAA